MILSFLALILAAAVAFVLLPFLFAYSGWSFVLVAAGLLIAAWFLLCYVGHVQAFLLDYIRKRRQR
jgi:hypothetical protein